MQHDDLRIDADRLEPKLIEWRRDIHRHPELGFAVHRTSKLVEAHLRELGLEVKTGIAETGVVGIVRTSSPSGPAVLLRADMDALPIQEETGLPFASTVPGRMHACGHDGHTSMLLGAANLLAARRDDLTRDVVLCFQPAEEGGGGGRKMIEDGVLDIAGAGEAYALHLWSPFPAGTVHVRGGAIMAASDEFTATIVGKGGHGAMPHLAVDPIVAASQAVVALQSIVSRVVDPLDAAVVTVGSFRSGQAPNVIPGSAVLEGTLRAFDPKVREALRRRTRETLEGAARGAGCTVDFELRPGYPAVINDVGAAEKVRRAGGTVFGEDGVREVAPMAASEDFSYFLEQVPGAFVFVGAGNEERGITAQHHSPRFDLDESVLARGAELLARLALTP